MERARWVDDERRSDAVAQGRRQGYRSDRLPFPAAPQPARRLTAQGAGPREERERLRKRSVVSRRQRRRSSLVWKLAGVAMYAASCTPPHADHTFPAEALPDLFEPLAV